MTDDATAIRSRAAAVLHAGEALRAASSEERALWLVEAAKTLSRHVESMGAQLSDATGLSVPMVHWASRTTLDTVREDRLLALGRAAHSEREQALEPIAMLAVVLAGNVFTASVRGIVVPLLLGVPVLAKASSKETMFPAMLRDALRRADSSLGAAVDLVAFPGGDVEREAALVERAEAVSVYASDETVAAMAARLGTDALICHGHGVSAAYCSARALEEARLADTIAGLSLDLCAYDQRGCLSPQLLYVAQTDRPTVLDFAQRLAADEQRGSAGPSARIGGRRTGAVARNCRGRRHPDPRRQLRASDSRFPIHSLEPRLSKHDDCTGQRDRRGPQGNGTDRLEPEVRRRRSRVDLRSPSPASPKPDAQCVRLPTRNHADARPGCAGGWNADLAWAASARKPAKIGLDADEEPLPEVAFELGAKDFRGSSLDVVLDALEMKRSGVAIVDGVACAIVVITRLADRTDANDVLDAILEREVFGRQLLHVAGSKREHFAQMRVTNERDVTELIPHRKTLGGLVRRKDVLELLESHRRAMA